MAKTKFPARPLPEISSFISFVFAVRQQQLTAVFLFSSLFTKLLSLDTTHAEVLTSLSKPQTINKSAAGKFVSLAH
jgi:hypothetical protein